MDTEEEIKLMKKDATGSKRIVVINKKKDWRILLFGFVILYKRNQKRLAIFSFLGIFTLFLSNIYIVFTASRYQLQNYLNDGWIIVK